MAHARPEYAIVLALLGILLAVGIPALQRGQLVVGGVCIALAAVVAVWSGLAMWRERG